MTIKIVVSRQHNSLSRFHTCQRMSSRRHHESLAPKSVAEELTYACIHVCEYTIYIWVDLLAESEILKRFGNEPPRQSVEVASHEGEGGGWPCRCVGPFTNAELAYKWGKIHVESGGEESWAKLRRFLRHLESLLVNHPTRPMTNHDIGRSSSPIQTHHHHHPISQYMVLYGSHSVTFSFIRNLYGNLPLKYALV